MRDERTRKGLQDNPLLGSLLSRVVFASSRLQSSDDQAGDATAAQSSSQSAVNEEGEAFKGNTKFKSFQLENWKKQRFKLTDRETVDSYFRY